MNVTTDPRLMKQLLLSQWSSNLNPLALTTASNEPSARSALFDMMLNQLLGSAGTLDDTSEVSTSDNIPLTPAFAPIPAALTAASVPAAASTSPALASAPGFTNRSGSSAASSYDELISAAASKYGVDTSLIKGVIQQESSFKHDAVSKSGAKGLMQLMDETARGLGVADSFDPAQNIDGGTRFLSYLLRRYDNNVSVALAAYNAGPGRIDRLGIATDADIAAKFHTLPDETQNYIGKVLEASRRWSV